MQWNNKENRLKPLLGQPCLRKIPWEGRSTFLKEIMKKVLLDPGDLAPTSVLLRHWFPHSNTSPWFQVTWVQNILWSKVRYFSQLGDRQFIGQPGLQALQAIDTGARDSSCCCCCCFPAKVITLFRRPQWSWGTAFHENYFFFSGKKCCFSQSANYPTCFKCKHGKNLQNIQPRHFILTTQMKHFDFLMLRSLAFLNLPPFNLVCSKR